MNNPVEVKLSLHADSFLNTLKELQEVIVQMKNTLERTNTINITVNAPVSHDVDAIVSRISEILEKDLANMGRITY